VHQEMRGLYSNFTKARKFNSETKKFSYMYKPKTLNVADCFNSKVKQTS